MERDGEWEEVEERGGKRWRGEERGVRGSVSISSAPFCPQHRGIFRSLSGDSFRVNKVVFSLDLSP